MAASSTLRVRSVRRTTMTMTSPKNNKRKEKKRHTVIIGIYLARLWTLNDNEKENGSVVT